jgi:hypothetical protein
MSGSPGRCIASTGAGGLQVAGTQEAVAAQIRFSSIIDALAVLALVAMLKV